MNKIQYLRLRHHESEFDALIALLFFSDLEQKDEDRLITFHRTDKWTDGQTEIVTPVGVNKGWQY